MMTRPRMDGRLYEIDTTLVSTAKTTESRGLRILRSCACAAAEGQTRTHREKQDGQ